MHKGGGSRSNPRRRDMVSGDVRQWIGWEIEGKLGFWQTSPEAKFIKQRCRVVCQKKLLRYGALDVLLLQNSTVPLCIVPFSGLYSCSYE